MRDLMPMGDTPLCSKPVSSAAGVVREREALSWRPRKRKKGGCGPSRRLLHEGMSCRWTTDALEGWQLGLWQSSCWLDCGCQPATGQLDQGSSELPHRLGVAWAGRDWAIKA